MPEKKKKKKKDLPSRELFAKKSGGGTFGKGKGARSHPTGASPGRKKGLFLIKSGGKLDVGDNSGGKRK